MYQYTNDCLNNDRWTKVLRCVIRMCPKKSSCLTWERERSDYQWSRSIDFHKSEGTKLTIKCTSKYFACTTSYLVDRSWSISYWYNIVLINRVLTDCRKYIMDLRFAGHMKYESTLCLISGWNQRKFWFAFRARFFMTETHSWISPFGEYRFQTNLLSFISVLKCLIQYDWVEVNIRMVRKKYNDWNHAVRNKKSGLVRRDGGH